MARQVTTVAEMDRRGRTLLAALTIEQLVVQYELTNRLWDEEQTDEARAALVRARTWITDELDSRGEAGDRALLALCGLEEW